MIRFFTFIYLLVLECEDFGEKSGTLSENYTEKANIPYE